MTTNKIYRVQYFVPALDRHVNLHDYDGFKFMSFPQARAMVRHWQGLGARQVRMLKSNRRKNHHQP